MALDITLCIWIKSVNLLFTVHLKSGFLTETHIKLKEYSEEC